jgi:hypothetical protein
MIQPFHSLQRRGRRQQRPLAVGRIGDRHTRNLARRVVAGQDAVSEAVPPIVSLDVGIRKTGSHCLPPRCRHGGERLEPEGVGCRAFASPWNGKAHSRPAVEIGQREAALVEAQALEKVDRATSVAAEPSSPAENGIARRLIGTATSRLDLMAGHVTEEIANLGGLTRSEVDHAAPSRMPRVTSRQLEVDVILI